MSCYADKINITLIGIQVLCPGVKLINSQVDIEEFICNVANDTVGGELAVSAGAIAARAACTAAATTLVSSGAAVTAPLQAPAAVVAGSIVKGLWDSIFH